MFDSLFNKVADLELFVEIVNSSLMESLLKMGGRGGGEVGIFLFNFFKVYCFYI